jgi:hypothetical protein
VWAECSSNIGVTRVWPYSIVSTSNRQDLKFVLDSVEIDLSDDCRRYLRWPGNEGKDSWKSHARTGVG